MKKTIKQRFWEKVDICSDEECWNWLGCKRNGYGRIYDYNLDSLVSAHRLSWKLKCGEYPSDDLKVLHKCDNPSCVNPNHLFLGTQQDNVNDMINKGRHRFPIGIQAHTNKLNENDIIEIRRLSSKLSISAIAETYKVSTSAIKHILKGRSWSWLS